MVGPATGGETVTVAIAITGAIGASAGWVYVGAFRGTSGGEPEVALLRPEAPRGRAGAPAVALLFQLRYYCPEEAVVSEALRGDR